VIIPVEYPISQDEWDCLEDFGLDRQNPVIEQEEL
jgi:hypothetical protein